MGLVEGTFESGIYRAGEVRLSDLAGRRALPVGVSDFRTVLNNYVFIDKSLLIADVLSMPGASLLYCRPRRFGKSLNLSMLQAFLEDPSPSDPAASDTEDMFRGLAIWDAEGGRFREHHGAYPVVRLSFNNVKHATWEMTVGGIRQNVIAEYNRHSYLAESLRLNDAEKRAFAQMHSGAAPYDEFSGSLLLLTQLLQKHHRHPVVVLIDEYDAPVMAGYTHGYYDEVVGFLKSWLTGALKDNAALAVGVLTGVQRISKESIFSDLNNLIVNTSMSTVSDERYGFMQCEIDALAAYRGQTGGVAQARAWYDGYRFGSVDVYNPWSVLNYFSNRCEPGVYWGNTSGNSVLGSVVGSSDDQVMTDLYQCMEPGALVEKRLDLGIVFPDIGIRQDAIWSMLYLAGYLTTNDTANATDVDVPRGLFIPNNEVRKLFRSEIVQRFSREAGSRDRLDGLHRAFVEGDGAAVAGELERILLENASYHDLTRESSYHTLLLGLLFGMPGYNDPVSNREAGRGRFDVRVQPIDPDLKPVITIEAKWVAPDSAQASDLDGLARAGLEQIAEGAYETGALAGSVGYVRWGIAFSGKSVACACERSAARL